LRLSKNIYKWSYRCYIRIPKLLKELGFSDLEDEINRVLSFKEFIEILYILFLILVKKYVYLLHFLQPFNEKLLFFKILFKNF
jgi:hypothetical protein